MDGSWCRCDTAAIRVERSSRHSSFIFLPCCCCTRLSAGSAGPAALTHSAQRPVAIDTRSSSSGEQRQQLDRQHMSVVTNSNRYKSSPATDLDTALSMSLPTVAVPRSLSLSLPAHEVLPSVFHIRSKRAAPANPPLSASTCAAEHLRLSFAEGAACDAGIAAGVVRLAVSCGRNGSHASGVHTKIPSSLLGAALHSAAALQPAAPRCPLYRQATESVFAFLPLSSLSAAVCVSCK